MLVLVTAVNSSEMFMPNSSPAGATSFQVRRSGFGRRCPISTIHHVATDIHIRQNASTTPVIPAHFTIGVESEKLTIAAAIAMSPARERTGRSRFTRATVALPP